VTLSGCESRKGLSEGVHDPLSARAAVFEHGDQRLALVSLDNIGFYGESAEPLRDAILKACGLQPSELFLCAIHTHSAPTLTIDPAKGHSHNLEYTRRLQERLIELVPQALRGLAPVAVGVGTGSSPVGVNRREVVSGPGGKAEIVLGPNPSVVTDREVQVLAVTAPESTGMVAVLFTYATHSTSLGPKNYLISGDIHGLAEQFLERYLGDGVVAAGLRVRQATLTPGIAFSRGFKRRGGRCADACELCRGRVRGSQDAVRAGRRRALGGGSVEFAA
jgi:hypothetical protein